MVNESFDVQQMALLLLALFFLIPLARSFMPRLAPAKAKKKRTQPRR